MSEMTVFGIENCTLGENPLWNRFRNCLHYVDIDGRKLISVDWKSKKNKVIEFSKKISSIALCKNGSLLFAFEDGIYTDNGNLIALRPPESGERFNDGKTSPDGNYFVGTINRKGNGNLYRLHNDKLETALNGIYISNGIDWTNDGNRMYYCDSHTQSVAEYSYPDMQFLRTVISFDKKDGVPDGLCTDNDGFLWIALWGAGRVVRVNPTDGTIVETVNFPTPFISCPAFAGEALNTLAVTSAANRNMPNDITAGRCFSIKVNAVGKLPYEYDMPMDKIAKSDNEKEMMRSG